jgi:hypothetical protein
MLPGFVALDHVLGRSNEALDALVAHSFFRDTASTCLADTFPGARAFLHTGIGRGAIGRSVAGWSVVVAHFQGIGTQDRTTDAMAQKHSVHRPLRLGKRKFLKVRQRVCLPHIDGGARGRTDLFRRDPQLP